MPELNPTPSDSELRKLPAHVLQYVFDLEQKVEQSFSVSHMTAVFLVGAAFGFGVGVIL